MNRKITTHFHTICSWWSVVFLICNFIILHPFISLSQNDQLWTLFVKKTDTYIICSYGSSVQTFANIPEFKPSCAHLLKHKCVLQKKAYIWTFGKFSPQHVAWFFHHRKETKCVSWWQSKGDAADYLYGRLKTLITCSTLSSFSLRRVLFHFFTCNM